MKKIIGFDKYAYTYPQYNIIQKKVIKQFLHLLQNRVVDLGCGEGTICKYKNFDFYLGIDVSENMLKQHPCNTLKLDFNTKECFKEIKKYDFAQIISFSALQWANDLEFVFQNIQELKKDYLLAIFTSNTFKSFHNYLNITSPIYSKEEILKYSSVLNPKIEVLNFKLEFNSAFSLLKYIKYSGVSGNVKSNISRLKKYIKNFPIRELEYEIVIIYNRYRNPSTINQKLN